MCTLVLSSKTGLESRIQTKYAEMHGSYDETRAFLLELGLVISEGGRLLPSRALSVSSGSNSDGHRINLSVVASIRNSLLDGTSTISLHVREYLSRFVLAEGTFEFLPELADNLKYSLARNLLVELGMVDFEENRQRYVLLEDPSRYLQQHAVRPKVGRARFAAILHQKEELGRRAELAAIVFERNRLSGFPDLSAQIRHVADEDVGAGYDVLSFEVPDNRSIQIPRYIEVKAVGPTSSFFMSANEMQVATTYRERYFLYLFTVQADGGFSPSGLTILQNPELTVFLNSNEWSRTSEITKFEKKQNPSED